jgi:hypothetical protein
MTSEDQAGSSATTGKETGGYYEIAPMQSIEKDGLLISYSMRVIPDKECNMIRLTLVLRNMQVQDRTISPQVSLTDISGKTIEAYTRAEFGKLSAQLAGKSPGSAINHLKVERSVKEASELRSRLENVNWLKSSYRIPARGIAIGELVYRCSQFKAPLILVVNSNRELFVFPTQSKLPLDR